VSRSQQATHQVFLRAMLQAAIAAALVFGISDSNPAFFIFSLVGILIAWFFSVRPNRPAPRLMINSILLLVIVIAGVEMLRIGVGVSAFAVFVVLLLIVKMLDLRQPRDDGQILVLTVAILIAAVLTSNTLITGVFMLISSVFILRAVVLFQIHSVLYESTRPTDALGKNASVDIRSMMLATGFLCASIGSVIFIVLPRNVGSQAFGQWGAGRSVSAFSDSVELGRAGLISQSSTPVLDLIITDRDGRNIGSENSPAVYLRGAVLSDYQDGHWKRSPIMQSPMKRRAKLIPANSSIKSLNDFSMRWDRQFEITMRSTDNGQTYLFAPWKTVELRVGSEPMRLGADFASGVFVKDGIGGRAAYSVRTVNTEFDPIDFSQLDRSQMPMSGIVDSQRFSVRVNYPSIYELTQQVLENAGIEHDPMVRALEQDLAAVRAIENYLRSQYTYSLDAQPIPPGEDATVWFLEELKSGHCEYYASALALMARSVGVQTRVITGYVVSDFNTVTSQYVVRQSNAHAWVEAQIAPGQWRTFDGTPRSDFHSIHEPDPSLWRSVSRVYESIEFLWVRSIIGYDSSARQNIIGGKTTDFGLSKLGDSLLNRYAAGRGRLISRAAVIGGIVFSITMFIGIIILRYRVLINHIRWWLNDKLAMISSRLKTNRDVDTDPRYLKIESLLHKSLEKVGIPKPGWKPLKAHISQNALVLESLNKPTRDSINEAAHLLYLYKFSSDRSTIEQSRLFQLELRLRKSEKSSDLSDSSSNS
jgi:protein-glutamine gamma-glutamyltransferase